MSSETKVKSTVWEVQIRVLLVWHRKIGSTFFVGLSHGERRPNYLGVRYSLVTLYEDILKYSVCKLWNFITHPPGKYLDFLRPLSCLRETWSKSLVRPVESTSSLWTVLFDGPVSSWCSIQKTRFEVVTGDGKSPVRGVKGQTWTIQSHGPCHWVRISQWHIFVYSFKDRRQLIR